MSRLDVLDEVYSSHIFATLINRFDDEILRSRWSTIDDATRQTLLSQIYPHNKDLNEQKQNNIRKVSDFYAFRMTDDCIKRLPLMMQRVLLLAEDSEMSDVLYLSTLGAISCCLPHYHGTLLGETIIPNLYVMLTGAAATGKGKAALAHKLIEPLDSQSQIFIAGNSSATAMYEALKDNMGRGLIFETELDTLTQAFKLGGDFSEGLRKAFHNEKISYLRRTQHERVNIPHPVLSMVLTGTPKQLPRMIKSAENGLFSRFLYYRLGDRRESFVESSAEAMTITGNMITDYLYNIGGDIVKLYEKLEQHKGVTFTLTPEQHHIFMDHFHSLSQTYEELSERAYATEDSSNDIEAMVRRMGNICYRILMILNMMRYADAEEIPSEIVCNPYDFQSILVMSEMLMHHSMVHYDELLQSTGVIGDAEEEPNLESEDLLNDRQRQCWEALPNKFIMRDAINIASELEIPRQTLERYLKQYSMLGILRKVSRGNYEKTEVEEIPEEI